MGVNLDELERLARESNSDTYSLNCYIASANPETVLKLIAELRALRRVAEWAEFTVDGLNCFSGYNVNCEHCEGKALIAEWRKLGGGE